MGRLLEVDSWSSFLKDLATVIRSVQALTIVLAYLSTFEGDNITNLKLILGSKSFSPESQDDLGL